MFIHPKIDKVEKLNRGIDDWVPSGIETCYADVDRFLSARSKRQYERLLLDYSFSVSPIYGRTESYWEANGEAFKDDALVDITTVADARNLSTLLAAGLLLCKLSRSSYPDSPPIKKDRFVIEEGSKSISLRIEILESSETMSYIEQGLDLRNKVEFNLIPTSYSADGKSQILMLEGVLYPGSYDDFDLQGAYEKMLDGLTRVMMNDLSIDVRNGEVVASCGSLASSLWSSMLDEARRGMIGECVMCGSPFVAPPKRRFNRVYCSDACKKMHQRITRFQDLVAQGVNQIDAAKQSGVSLTTALDYIESTCS